MTNGEIAKIYEWADSLDIMNGRKQDNDGIFIKGIPRKKEKLLKIRNLILDGDNIEHLPKEIFKLPNIESIDIVNTTVVELPKEVMALKGISLNVDVFLKNIKFLNHIKRLYLDGYLYEDDEDRSYKETFIPDELWNMINLKWLKLSGFNDKKISKNIEKLEKLEKLILDSYDLNSLPEEIQKLKKLKEVDLRETIIDTNKYGVEYFDSLEIFNGVKLTQSKKEKVSVKNSDQVTIQPLNQILYGPPGTGKTYHTIDKALQIIDGTVPDNRKAAKERFEVLKETGQIVFATFHQSYGYEEFIEGIKAKTTDKGIEYQIESGIFKRLCNEANDFNLKSIFKIDTKIGKYKIVGISNELLKLERENKTIIPIPMYLLREVLELIDKKNITPNDLNDKSAIDEMNETTEKFIINGYPNVFRDLAIYYLKNKDNFYEKLEIYLSELDNHEKILKTIEGREFSVTLSPNRGVKTSTDHSFSREKLFEISKGIYKNNPDNTYAKHIVDDIIKSIRITKQNYILIIDEINRGNISKIFGELITLIEESKRLGNVEAMEITLPYSGEKFGVPKNLYIIGTMNTADRSIALMDTALRRRFEFEEMMPNPCLLYDEEKTYDLEGDDEKEDITQLNNWDMTSTEHDLYFHKDYEHDMQINNINLRRLLYKINQRIEYLYDRDHTIGHAYFMGVTGKEALDSVMRNKVIPLLQEYFYDDWEKVQIVLGDHKEQTKSDTDKFIISVKNSEKDILGFNYDELDEEGYSYSINASFTNEAYLKIYE